MIPVLLSTLIAASSPSAEFVRETLDNGAVLHVQELDSPSFHILLNASNRTVALEDLRQGHQHLFEHLVTVGPRGDLDLKLESRGCVLEATSNHDGLTIEISGPPNMMATALSSIAELLGEREYLQEAINKELEILSEEAALNSDQHALSAVAWQKFFDEEGWDLQTVPDSSAPDIMNRLHRELFASNNLVLIVAGNMDQQVAADTARRVLGSAKPTEREARPGRQPSLVAQKDSSVDSRLSGWAVAVPAIGNPKLVNTLAASMFASAVIGGRPQYNPSGGPGVLLLTTPKAGKLHEISDAEVINGFVLGRNLVTRWAITIQQNPIQLARVYGRALHYRRGFNVETLYNQAITLTSEDFREAFDELKSSLEMEGR